MDHREEDGGDEEWSQDVWIRGRDSDSDNDCLFCNNITTLI